MNKLFWQVIIIFVFLVSACTPSKTNVPDAITQIATETSSPLPTSTQTSIPSATLTASITPLPTIPTFTPTFDTSTIVTVTSAPKVECPTIDPTVKPEDYLPTEIRCPASNVTNEILKYLNKGGNGRALIQRLDKIYSKSEYHGGYEFLDVTGDQVPEFLYVELNYVGKPLVFSCRNGKFEILTTLSGNYDFLEYTMEIDDLNANGIPEILITGTSGASFPVSTIYIYEWNGHTFSILGQVTIGAMRQFHITNIDENRNKEIVLSGDNPTCTSCSNFIPQRERTITLGWNGKEFAEISNEFTPSEYRFQAIQDADATVIIGQYNKAMKLYNQTISDMELGWWSPDRLFYEQTIHDPVTMFIETPSTTPTPDTNEYPRLAAYAYYRIMLLHLVQNQEPDATTTYNTLQEKFGNDQYAHPYMEMATAFWEAYQPTHKMYDGCAAAIQYAAEHPEILTPLGSDYHGSQSHTYVPADVCPFR